LDHDPDESPVAAEGDLAGPPSGPFLDQPGAVPRDRADAGTWLLFAVVGFLVGSVVGLLFAALAAELAGQGSHLAEIAKLSAPPEWYVAASLVGLWVGFIVGPWLASRFRGTRRFAADLGLRFRLVDLWGVAVGLLGQLLVDLMYAPFHHHHNFTKNFNAPTTRLTGASHGGGFVVIALLTVVGAPFFEELFFRGLLLRGLVRVCTPARRGRSLGRTFGVVAAVLLDGLLFGLAHGELVQLAGLAAFGMILAVVSYRTGRLGMNMVAHATFNLAAVLTIAGDRSVVFH